MTRGTEAAPRDMMIRTSGSRGWVAPAVLLALVFVLTVASSAVMAGSDTTLIITTDASTDYSDPMYVWVYTIDLGEAVTITWTLDTQTASGVTFAGELTRCVTFPVGSSCNILGGGVETSGGEPFDTEYFFAPSAAGYYSIDGSYEGCTICGLEAPELSGCDAATKYLRVDKVETAASVESNANPSVTGQTVTFTATVTSNWIGGPAIGGTAEFYIDEDGAGPNSYTLVCSETVSSGQATCEYAFPAVGLYPVYVEYVGDDHYVDSTSSGLDQQVVAETTTAVSVDCYVDPDLCGPPFVTGQELRLLADVSNTSTINEGTVSFYADVPTPGTWLADYAVTSGQAVVGPGSFNAEDSPIVITAVYNGTSNYLASEDSTTIEIYPAQPAVFIDSDDPDPSYLWQPYVVAGHVAGPTWAPVPTGYVKVYDGLGGEWTGAIDPTTGSWSCAVIPTDFEAGPPPYVELSAAYHPAGDPNYTSASTLSYEVHQFAEDPSTRTEVMGADTPLIVFNPATFEVHVVDIVEAYNIPQGTVTITVDPGAQGALNIPGPPYDLTLDAAGRCMFTYTPTSAATSTHLITAQYNGEDDPGNGWFHEPSEGNYPQQIVRRAADMTLTLDPTTAYIGQPIMVIVHVEDDTTEGTPWPPSGTVTLDDGGKNGWFSPADTVSLMDGQCSVLYTPGPFDVGLTGVTTITAVYNGSDVHTGKTRSAVLAVELRPVEVHVACSQEPLFVNEAYTGCTITVKDVGEGGIAISPLGAISSLTTVLATDGNGSTNSGTYNLAGPTFPSYTESEWTFDYLCTGLDPDAEGGYDTITAEFTASDGIHASTSGAFIQPLLKRFTITTLSGCTSTASGVQCIVTVEEDPGNGGIPMDIEGKIYLEKGDSDELVCTLSPGPSPSCTFTVDSDALLANVTVRYEPTDNVHLASTDSVNVSRADQPEFDPDQGGDGTTGADCADGCGDGGVNIDQMIFDLNAADTALAAVQMGLESASIALDLIPDGVVTAGIVVQTGVTIPYSDIAAAIVSGSALALEIARTAMTSDLDGDGLPDTVEQTVTDTDYTKVDTDADAMSDSDEIGYCAGYYGGTLRPNPNDPDSDDDGILDGYELAPFCTDVCVADTDCDTLPDGVEIACRTAPTADNGFDVASFAALGYSSYSFPFDDPRDQPNPREADTDGDGIPDNVEFASSSCTYVNEADSDDDGLDDGVEDWDASGSVNCLGSCPAGTGTQASTGWETDPCDVDTDGDGLSDGEEFQLLGGLVQDPDTWKGSGTTPYVDVSVDSASHGSTTTVPALDTDSDDDGLSDYEEVNVTGTDPLNWDTDGDSLSDLNELMATGGTWPARTFAQVSDPLDPDTDDDDLLDNIEYSGTGMGTSHGTGGSDDTDCPYVNDDDSDDDGLQDGYEVGSNGVWEVSEYGSSTGNGVGETDACNEDTDNDGLLDGEEEGLFGQGFVAVTTELGTPTTVPAVDTDCDNDGLSDYEEVHVTMTDPLHWDTDGDGLSDAEELIVTGGGPFPVFSQSTNVDGVARSFYQESDPLDPDTDDDGIRDDVEYNDGAGSGVDEDSTASSNPGDPDEVCPYVNDDDSDDDGLQDGTEGWLDRDINITYALGDTGHRSGRTTQDDGGVGETDFCNPDTDGDGLTDGEEFALFGGLLAEPDDWHPSADPAFEMVTAVDPSGATVSTIPALDDDCDDDGLSDYEEVNVTGTDALDADSDDDGLLDSWEVIVTAGDFPYRSFYQESDPLDPDTDDDEIRDDVEYNGGAGSGVGRNHGDTSGEYGARDEDCPFVNDDDSDGDGLQDGVEDANHDGVWGVKGPDPTYPGVGTHESQAPIGNDGYYETDLCNPDTDGDGLLDGEEVLLIGGRPVPSGGFNPQNPLTRAMPGFYPVAPEGVSTEPPILGDLTSPLVTPAPPATRNNHLGPYSFDPVLPVPTVAVTVPALDSDSDNDGLSDYEEVNITGTDPLDKDTDNDTLMDSEELIATSGAWPQRTFDQESDPLDINTDDDHLFDPQEYPGSGLGTTYIGNGAPAGDRDTECPFVNDDDSDDDAIQDGARVEVDPALTVIGTLLVPPNDAYDYSYTHYEDFIDVGYRTLPFPGIAASNVDDFDGEERDDNWLNVCDPDSDGDGLNDGEEIAIGTNPDDCDTDNDGRNDWHEVTGGGPIPTDPFDPDTDDDGLLDSAEVFGSNPTNPTNADTDSDGLCDGGTGTPWMTENLSDPRVVVNPICKSCAEPGLDPCAVSVRPGSADGIGDHPNPHGYGEDKNGNGQWDGGIGDEWVSGDAGTPETDPNQHDTDGDGDGDGIEVLGFSTSRQYMIPPADIFGREITVEYPACGCLEPLIADTDQDGLEDGYEDRNHDGNFDFLPSEFDHQDPLPGPPIPYPTETNPCDPDTDHDGLTDWEERFQRQPLLPYPDVPYDDDGDGFVDEDRIDGIDNDGDGFIDEDPPWDELELTFNPTNPLDHDTDNDWLDDGTEVYWTCVALEYWTLDNDTDGLTDEDPIDGMDNDGDGLIDEDPQDFWIRFVPMLDPTNRDSDSDGWIDGLDDDPCNSELIPQLAPVAAEPIDTDGDGFSDDDELLAGTHPNDPDEHPIAYGMMNLDLDGCFDDRLWLEPSICCGIANSVVIDIDSNILSDIRVQIVQPRDVRVGDFDGDGYEDDARYLIEYAFALYRVVQKRIVATIDDFDMDLVIDAVSLEQK